MILMLRARSGDGQWVKAETYDIRPRTPVIEYADVYGNFCQRLATSADNLTVETTCHVDVADEADAAPGLLATPVEALPTSVFHYLLPSRYCESDKMLGFTNDIVAGVLPGYDQAEAVRTWVHQNVQYVLQSTNSSTSAFDTWVARQGVCRDQAHLAIALCRALNLPTRLVVGFLVDLEPMDLHAWLECYIGDRWWTFDPKEATTRGGRIVIGYGRDAADVAFVTQFGPSILKDLDVRVERLG